VTGRAFVFGDGIDTDVLAPGHMMKAPIEALAQHCLEAVDPAFAASVRPGDVVVAGANFGHGSSREQAAQALVALGISAVLATSFARTFYRNAINVGLPAVVFPRAAEVVAGDVLSIDPLAGRVENLTLGRAYQVAPIPQHLMAMINDGGLIPHLKRRFRGRTT
jgi:3-isopropylmalate/(R)-2-methylmalate dehydratase small subunit